jgi:hypothetical protein
MGLFHHQGVAFAAALKASLASGSQQAKRRNCLYFSPSSPILGILARREKHTLACFSHLQPTYLLKKGSTVDNEVTCDYHGATAPRSDAAGLVSDDGTHDDALTTLKFIGSTLDIRRSTFSVR